MTKAPQDSQFARPRSLTGRLLLRGMNKGHRPLHLWGLEGLGVQPDERVIDIGCGGGAILKRLLGLTRREVAGIDHSADAVRTSLALNRAAAETGRLRVLEAPVDRIPMRSGYFDAATAFETLYFWPDQLAGLAEVHRVLRPGGRLLIINDYASRDAAGFWADRLDMSVPDGEELSALASQAGFVKVDWDLHPRRGWLRVLAIA
ncbi:class I SAM-dependent methyltransferase [Actinomyces sp. zg296]|uniref:class I SAM-dependent methyltransferase n=1 Tax=Actinomyces sp. zg296 TaxID=2609289 RepID=UPI00135AA046|nr:methyltransferase domain-containing protein [Actinomyces sp. zg296]